MRKRTRSFANRLGMWIMAVLIVMSLIIMGAVYWITRDAMAREAEERYQSIVLHSNEKIRGVLSDVYVAAVNNIDMIEHDIDDPDKLQAHLERIVSLNQYMSSCRLIFEPDVFPQKGHNFEIYAWKQVPDIIKSKQMNETHPDFLVHRWYKPAFEKEEGSWTPPYFDRAASQQLTVTYLIHLHDHQGRKVGMLGADVSLQWLRQRHKKIDEANHNLYEKAHFVPFGTDFDFFSGEGRVESGEFDEHREHILLSVGYAKRDYKTLCEAWKKADVGDYRLRIVGDDSLKELYKDCPNIEFSGKIPIAELMELTHRCTAVIVPLPEYMYSYGQMTILQSMAMAKPMIVTRTTSTADYIDKASGVIAVEPEDIDSMALSIEKMCSLNDTKLRQMGDKNQAYVKSHFNEMQMAEKIEEIITKYLQR